MEIKVLLTGRYCVGHYCGIKSGEGHGLVAPA